MLREAQFGTQHFSEELDSAYFGKQVLHFLIDKAGNSPQRNGVIIISSNLVF